jgi:hypothetical protein
MSLLADHQAIKTICITTESDVNKTGRLSTRLMRYFVTDSASNCDDLITVVIKGQELTLPLVQTLVSSFFSHAGTKHTNS